MHIQGEHDRGNVVGLNQHSGDPIDPQMEGIFDNYSVKRQIINSGYARISYHFDVLCFFFAHNLFCACNARYMPYIVSFDHWSLLTYTANLLRIVFWKLKTLQFEQWWLITTTFVYPHWSSIIKLPCGSLFCRPVIASQLLLVDEVIRAGRNMRKPN